MGTEYSGELVMDGSENMDCGAVQAVEGLEKVEAKELEEENSTKGVKSKKGAALPKGKKVTPSGSETLKSPHGRRVAPMVDDELRKKYDKVAGATKAKQAALLSFLRTCIGRANPPPYSLDRPTIHSIVIVTPYPSTTIPYLPPRLTTHVAGTVPLPPTATHVARTVPLPPTATHVAGTVPLPPNATHVAGTVPLPPTATHVAGTFPLPPPRLTLPGQFLCLPLRLTLPGQFLYRPPQLPVAGTVLSPSNLIVPSDGMGYTRRAGKAHRQKTLKKTVTTKQYSTRGPLFYDPHCNHQTPEGQHSAPTSPRGKKTKAGEEKDEFDILGDTPTKSLAERLGNSPEQLEKKMATKKKETKQTKAPRTKKEPAKKIDSPKKKGRKRPSWESGSSDEMNSSDDEDGSEAVSVPVRTTTRRAAVLNTSDAMFDNLVGSGSGGSVDAPVEVSSDDDMFSNKKKAAPKKRMLHKIDKEAIVQIQKKTVPKRAPKKRIYLDDSLDEEEDIIPKKSRGKKKVESSDEEFTIEDSDF
uniref:Uncharacterized protein n=1 Tax=Timema cristinae TaxID=61476 RepID=A0A7R9CZ76_TIMCR|nr:unnamed protein product [Timema cristinae]